MRCWITIIAGILSIGAARHALADGRPTTSSAPGADSASQVIQENLALLISENTPQARRLGAARLIELGEPAIPRLLEILSGNSTRLSAQIAICEAVASFTTPPDRLYSALVKNLGSTPQLLNDTTVLAIQRYPAQRIVENIAPIARDPQVALSRRLAAISCLAEASDDGRAIKALVGLVDDPSSAIVAGALVALSTATGVEFADAQAAVAWWKLNENNTPSQWLALSNLARRKQTRQARSDAITLSRRIVTIARDAYLSTPEPQRDQKLLILLKDELPPLRILGLDLINDLITDRKEIGPDTKSELVELINDPDVPVRTSAARTCSELRLDGAFQTLVAVLKKENNSEAKAAQIESLERLDDLSAIPIIIHFLDDQDPLVVGRTVLAIGSLARTRADGLPPQNGLSAVILEKFKRLPADSSDVRVKFIQAMARMAAPEYLSTLREEARRGDPLCRAAAIAGLAEFGADLQSNEEILACLSAPEPVIRLAAIEAIGKCGRSRDDLAALTKALSDEYDGENAPREIAWKSYLSICERLESDELLACASEFGLQPDKPAQQRCLDILKILRNSNDRFDKLDLSRRVSLLSKIGRVQDQLGDFAAAAASYEQAAQSSGKSAASADLLLNCFRCRLKARKDSLVLEQLSACSAAPRDAETVPCERLADIFLSEMAARIDAAEDARSLEENRALVSSSTAMLEPRGYSSQLKDISTRCSNRKVAVIDKLLLSLPNDPEAQIKLGQFKSDDVIPRIVDRLKSNGQHLSREELLKLIELGKKLAPGWKGFDPDAGDPTREKSLEDLKAAISITHYSPSNR